MPVIGGCDVARVDVLGVEELPEIDGRGRSVSGHFRAGGPERLVHIADRHAGGVRLGEELFPDLAAAPTAADDAERYAIVGAQHAHAAESGGGTQGDRCLVKLASRDLWLGHGAESYPRSPRGLPVRVGSAQLAPIGR